MYFFIVFACACPPFVVIVGVLFWGVLWFGVDGIILASRMLFDA